MRASDLSRCCPDGPSRLRAAVEGHTKGEGSAPGRGSPQDLRRSAMSQRSARRQVNRLPPERRISDIMIAARAVFAEKGYSDALVSDIAERAGVVEGSI